jgi:bifunctional non-homologous end joining protein LigD
MALVQAGVLEIHVWGSSVEDIEACNRIVFDLDPAPEVEWPRVIDAAREVRDRLDRRGLESFVKTTGGKGLHVVVPIAGADWDAAKSFAHGIAREMAADAPTRYTSNMAKRTRTGRIFVDYLRNGRGATSVAAYSTRARAGAPVSTPIRWDELSARLAPNHFTLLNLRKRLAALRSDPWADIGQIKQKLPPQKRGK